MAGASSQPRRDLWEQREFELATNGRSEITASRPGGRPKDLDDAFAHVDLDVEHGKRNRNGSSDNPMADWHPWLKAFLEETHRRHGLGNSTSDPKCSKCGVCMVSTAEAGAEAERVSDAAVEGGCSGGCGAEMDGPTSSPPRTCTELYRCQDCGDFLECRECSLDRHALSPLHIIQVWRDECWNRTSLYDMGLVYQVGHQSGRCINPDQTPRSMSVIHVNGIHTVRYMYCSCDISDYENKWQQLLRNGWYPATTPYPATCATMEVVKHFR
ncbi:hypothetical protein BDZ89DRAFT_1146427 [Hymenopellis radicata]|nr:hypothetical protein BDZ89DRAFT_1146427 [Hymenopellis radicata]